MRLMTEGVWHIGPRDQHLSVNDAGLPTVTIKK